MNPRLIAVSGALEDQTFALDAAGPITLGRHSANDIRIPEVDVSRHHAEIRGDGDGFVLRDLDSRHGTFVNAVPVGERLLGHGDVIRVGHTMLLFVVDAVASATASPVVEASDSRLDLRSTVHRPSGDSLYLRPEQLRASLPRTDPERAVRIASDLNALFEISTVVQQARDVGELAGQLLDRLLAALPAGSGTLLLLSAGDDEPTVAGTRARPGETVGEKSAAVFSHRLMTRVLSEKVGLVADDPDGRSFLVVPLVGQRQPLGALSFESRDATFSEPDLEIATAAATIATLALENLQWVEGLRAENRRLQPTPEEHGMVGESPELRRLLDVLARVAPVDSTVLLRGASGTGKELAARALHRGSPRADGPFVAVNCATLSETLLESELFGHERGAFTGAVARKIGKIEVAEGGTLFLDEVAEVPPPLQARLLRVLQEREIDRVGGTRPIAVDVRLVAATHRDLEAAIAAGAFREDFFYRLNVITVTLPALRERRADIPLLARHFAALHGRRLRRREVGLTAASRRVLMAYAWPGNVRQLSNAVERAVVLGDGDVIRPEDLPDEVLEGAAPGVAVSDFQAAIVETKKKLLTKALTAADDNAAEAARLLGLHPNSFRRLMRQLGLKATGD